MSDLVKRLRIKAGVMSMGERIAWGSDTELMLEGADRIEQLEQAIRETIMDNLHLADGEICTLITLKRAINFSLDDELGSDTNDDGTTES